MNGTLPIRSCASCGRDASQVDAETLNCVHCGGNPFVEPEAQREVAGILDAHNYSRLAQAWHEVNDIWHNNQPASVEGRGRYVLCSVCGDGWFVRGREIEGEYTCFTCQHKQEAQAQAQAPSARTPDGGSRAYRALLDEAWQLHIAKNTGYAGHSPDPWANFRMCEAFGIPATDGTLTRMSDKWSRLQSLWRNPERDQVGESLIDTLKDLSAYANILICLLQEDE